MGNVLGPPIPGQYPPSNSPNSGNTPNLNPAPNPTPNPGCIGCGNPPANRGPSSNPAAPQMKPINPPAPQKGQNKTQPMNGGNIPVPKPYSQLTNAMPQGAEFNPAYVKWKLTAEYSDYMNARKFHSWKGACGGNLYDRKLYDTWKKSVWDNFSKNDYKDDFHVWKNRLDWEDYMRWKEFCEWERRNQHSEIVPKNLKKYEKDYKRFLKRANVKKYAKFYKFQDWMKHCENSGKKVADISSYWKWSNKYEYNNPEVLSSFEDWKKSGMDERDLENWVTWMKWQKLREKAATLTEFSESDNPDWYKRNKDYGKYRK